MISDEDLQKLKDRLEGTCESLAMALSCLELDDVDIDEAEDRLLDGRAMEPCCKCGWWGYSMEMIFDDDNPPVCDSCHEYEDE